MILRESTCWVLHPYLRQKLEADDEPRPIHTARGWILMRRAFNSLVCA